MKSAQRVWLTPAYLLHQYAYRDTSRIAELFTHHLGGMKRLVAIGDNIGWKQRR